MNTLRLTYWRSIHAVLTFVTALMRGRLLDRLDRFDLRLQQWLNRIGFVFCEHGPIAQNRQHPMYHRQPTRERAPKAEDAVDRELDLSALPDVNAAERRALETGEFDTESDVIEDPGDLLEEIDPEHTQSPRLAREAVLDADVVDRQRPTRSMRLQSQAQASGACLASAARRHRRCQRRPARLTRRQRR